MMRDFNGNLIRTDFSGRKIPKKQIKKAVIEENRRKGKMGEQNYVMRAQLAGYDVERTGKGHDYKLYKTNIRTGKRTFIGYREIKTGNAKTSKLQNKTKAKNKRYKVIREETFLY